MWVRIPSSPQKQIKMKELLEKLDLIQSELNHINGKLDNTLDNLKIIKNELKIMDNTIKRTSQGGNGLGAN
jgi:hypothetical protein